MSNEVGWYLIKSALDAYAVFRTPAFFMPVHAPPLLKTRGWCPTLTDTLKDGQSSSGSKGCGERHQELVLKRHVSCVRACPPSTSTN